MSSSNQTRQFSKSVQWLVLIALIFQGASCGGLLGTSEKTAELVDSTLQDGANRPKVESPVVEAFVEYVGPDKKWLGPDTFTIHIDAQDSEKVVLEGGPIVKAVKSKILSIERVRADLAELSRAVSAQAEGSVATSAPGVTPSALADCLYLVRVRLVRADWMVEDKTGCRGQKGWPALLGKTITSILQTEQTGRAPASRAVTEFTL